jgi:hypothetical protein
LSKQKVRQRSSETTAEGGARVVVRQVVSRRFDGDDNELLGGCLETRRDKDGAVYVYVYLARLGVWGVMCRVSLATGERKHGKGDDRGVSRSAAVNMTICAAAAAGRGPTDPQPPSDRYVCTVRAIAMRRATRTSSPCSRKGKAKHVCGLPVCGPRGKSE